MNKMILSTTNVNKIKEINAIVSDLGIQVLSLEDVGLGGLEVEEDGDSYEENALKKAREVQKRTGIDTIADDSGLEVDALNGAPGIYSARFSGENATAATNNEKLLDALKDVPEAKRTARFVSAIAVVFANGEEATVRGTVEGTILHEPKGTNGFGYDPLFYWAPGNCTFAEMESATKNSISHRANALKAFKALLASRKG